MLNPKKKKWHSYFIFYFFIHKYVFYTRFCKIFVVRWRLSYPPFNIFEKWYDVIHLLSWTLFVSFNLFIKWLRWAIIISKVKFKVDNVWHVQFLAHLAKGNVRFCHHLSSVNFSHFNLLLWNPSVKWTVTW